MIITLHTLLITAFSYFSWTLAFLYLPLFAIFYKRPPALPLLNKSKPLPFLWIVAPGHNAVSSIPGLVEGLKRQTYPADRFQITVLADNCNDNSAKIARSLGAHVYERHNLEKMGKGYALNEFLGLDLRNKKFDAIIIFDIDCRVGPDFLEKAAAYFQAGASVLQGETVSKNPQQSLYTRVGDFIQALIRSYQRGRSLLGLNPMMIGSHGIGLSRESLDRLNWQICTDIDGDDMELGLLCALNDIPIQYAPLLAVSNDLPTEAGAIRKQRRRWTRSTFRLTARYVVPLLKKALQGRLITLDVLFNLLLNPSFSNFFIFLTLTAGILGGLGFYFSFLRGYAMAWALLWLASVIYFTAALRSAGMKVRWSDPFKFALYLGIRAVAFFEALWFIRSKEWWPTSHPDK